jgi:serine protease AprX
MGSGYRAISITDPGNADYVITVGSTHRRDPHLYGVSYFSARGPTGDGRRKPDILAPGEKITSTIPGGQLQRMDGTSMAAPHVSGAAAMLMGRYPELIGRPLRIKQVLMDSATDLKREPNFQGAGLVDVLRALQSV